MGYSNQSFNDYKDGDVGETKVCVRCKKIFVYLGFGHYYCPSCKKQDEMDFNKVKEYIYANGVASAIQVSEQTGVNLKVIEQYLKEGRLEIPENSPIFIKCEMCSIDIRSGRLCRDCASKLSRAMRKNMGFDDEQIGDVPKKMVGKMRFLKNEK